MGPGVFAANMSECWKANSHNDSPLGIKLPAVFVVLSYD